MVGVDDGAGGFFAEDFGFWRGVEAGAEVAARIGGVSVCRGCGGFVGDRGVAYVSM